MIMSDAFTPYERGLKAFQQKLGESHERLLDFLNYDHQLHANIRQAQDDGDTPILSADRNRIARQSTYVTFEALDAPWKHLTQPRPDGTYPLPDPEPHWGIFTSDRIPKEAAANICPVR